MKKDFAQVGKLIERYRGAMASTLAKMMGIKSVSPESGGEGEAKRADFLQKLLERWGFEVKRYDYTDRTRTKRSSLVTKMGNNERTVWFIAHIDTVSEGDRSLWKTDPFRGRIEGGRVYGRGAADDGDEVVASIFALRALEESGIRTKYNVGVALVADEETGSAYGVKKLMGEKIFGSGDMIVVPDFEGQRGDEIEISEKGALWLKITVHGKQVHASTPDEGENAYRNAIRFLNDVDVYLHKKYNARNRLFDVPYSTFEMTKHEKNVDSTNIIPGKDVSYIDCRVLPEYKADSVIADVRKIAKRKEFDRVKIDVDIFQREDAAKPTSERAEIVRMLKSALKELRGIDARCVGIGGGTVAYFFRKKEIPAAVWSTMPKVAHQPNEYAIVDLMVADAKVFAYLCI